MKTTTAAMALFVTLAPLLVAPQATGQIPGATVEGYEACAVFDPPPCAEDLYTHSSAGVGSTFAVDAPAHTGARSMRVVNVAGQTFTSVYEVLDPSLNFCEQGADFWLRLEDLPTSSAKVQIDDMDDGSVNEDSIGFTVDNLGAVLFVVDPATSGGGINTATGLTVTPDTWYHFALTCQQSAGTNLYKQAVFTEYTTLTQVVVTLTSTYTFTALHMVNLRAHLPVQTPAVSMYLDDVSFATPDAVPDSNQVAVTGLTGYSMDAGGRNIVVRTDGGATVETYGVGDLTQIATAGTPDCGARADGVNAALYHGEVWVTYVDCDGDGESDAFRIRDVALAVPSFPCDEATGDVDNNAEVDVPNDVGDVGTISDLNPSYIDRCGDAGFDDASVAWSYSTVGGAGVGGRVGAFGVVYNSGDLVDDTDEENVALDTSATPSVSQFCSWQTDGGHDYIGASVDNGPTGVFEVISSVNQQEVQLGKEIDVDLVQKFLNTGTYGNAAGVACAGDVLVVLKGTAVHVLLNITGAPTVAPGWPKTISDTHERGVAITGSAEFIAVNYENEIHVFALNGTETEHFPEEATGTWKGMEFDHSGEHLAEFTSSFITVWETADATCALAGNCAELGDLEEEGGPSCADPPCETTTTTGGAGSGGGAAGDFGAFGNFIAAVAVTFGAVIVGYAITRRKEEGGGGQA